MPYSDMTFAIVDTETTGTNAKYDRVIEIGILRVEQGKVVAKYKTLVNPERRIPEFITAITGITNQELEGAPTFAEVAEEVKQLFDDAIFVAHNVRFDYGFIKQEFARQEILFAARLLCTVELSRKIFPEYRHHDLSSLIERYGFACKARHRAFDDAAVLWDFMSMLAKSKQHGELFQTKLDELLHAMPAIPPLLTKAALKKLPEGHGVYIFYGKNGEVLYVGKSVNLRTRILSHFSSSAEPKDQRLRNEVADIETRGTFGEFGALLLELELIKTMQPLYNRLSRRVKTLAVLREKINEQGYKSATIERVLSIEGIEDGTLLGVFRSIQQAEEFLYELAKEQELCPQLFGLEKGRHGCFAYSLKRCRGACVGTEDQLAYNSRFDGAFSERRIRIWPFEGPMLFEERGTNESLGQAFLIDQWRLVKRFTYDEGGVREAEPASPLFDYDAYKILVKFLLNPKYKRSLRSVPAETADDLTLAYE